jgi:hypothetical protein
MKRKILLASLVVAIASPAADGLAQSTKNERPQSFEALLRCRAVTDSAARLACFDSAAATLESAAERNDLVVVDRQQIRKTKRTLFGLSIPNLDIFGDDDKEPEVKSIDSTIASARRDPTGKWVVRLQEGAFWRQIDDRPLAMSPKPGNKVQINRTPMGSYMMRVGSQPGIRVRREN